MDLVTIVRRVALPDYDLPSVGSSSSSSSSSRTTPSSEGKPPCSTLLSPDAAKGAAVGGGALVAESSGDASGGKVGRTFAPSRKVSRVSHDGGTYAVFFVYVLVVGREKCSRMCD